MTTSFPETPLDWLAAENVLLDGVPQFSLGELADRLAFAPFAKLNRERISDEERLEYLEMPRLPYEPTKQGVDAAAKVMAMLRGGLIARNPGVAQNRRTRMKLLAAEARSDDKLPKIPSASFAVRIWKGITGLGKSALRARLLSLLPQVVERGPSPDLWERLSHLIYLEIPLLDGTRGGFLESILSAMDDALGTTYAIDLPKRHRTVDRLLVATIARMHAHYLGLLVIEEAQWRNLVASPQADQMQVFLLSIMNTGIPVLIIGNPLAFDWAEDFTQDVRRLNERGCDFFHPVGAMNEESAVDDRKAVAYGVTSYYVLKEPPKKIKECKEFLNNNLGGIGGLQLSIWCNAQERAVLDGKLAIGPEDLELEFRSERFAPYRPLADAFSRKQSLDMLGMKDVPWKVYATAWGQMPTSTAKATDNASGTLPPTKTHPPASDPGESVGGSDLASISAALNKQQRKQFAASQTRTANRAAKRSALQKSLDPGDMRISGLQQHAVEGLGDMFKMTASAKKKA